MEHSFPIRINRYLALKGYATRRKADELIQHGRVFLNGSKAQLGDQVQKNDRVEVRGHTPNTKRVYLAYHKPENMVTHGPQGDEVDIISSLGRKDVFPLGRLDKKSRGLILLTNDGRVTGPLLEPSAKHEKEYRVTVDKKISNHFLKWMQKGVSIEGYVTKPAEITKESDVIFHIVLTEGKTHQIRRMCAALGYVVRDLLRIRIMNIKLGTLKPNEARDLTDTERESLLRELGISV